MHQSRLHREAPASPRPPETHGSGSGRARRSADAVARLVQRAAAGDERACRDLVEEYSGLLWAVARSYRLGEADAADVAQTTWLHMLEHLDKLRDPARLGGWLATTARHECVKVLRQKARLIPHDELPEPADDDELNTTLLAQERDRTLLTALDALRPSDRALLRLLIADPTPSYEEISATLNMPIGSIGPTRARALQRLRREAERLGLTDAALQG